jgi:hypothetical protein
VRLEGQSSSTKVGAVELYADPAPFDDFHRVATTRVGHLGAIKFVVKPDRNTRYRAKAGGAQSKPVTSYVASRIKVLPTLVGPSRVRVIDTAKLHAGAKVNPTPVYFYFARKGAKRFRLLGSRRAAAAGPGKARAVYEFNLAAPRRGDRYVACTKRNYASDMGRAKAKIKACGNRTISSQELALPPPP